jgi:transposase
VYRIVRAYRAGSLGIRVDQVVMDNDCMYKAKAVEQWLASHPRVGLLWLPTYCLRANPLERVFGDVHDKCTRHHKRKRLRDLMKDVERHVQVHGSYRHKISHVYNAPEGTAAVEDIAAEKHPKVAA